MLSFFRRVSKSKIGTGIMAFVLVAILAGFAVADLSNFGSGKIGFGMSSGTLAKVGDQEVNEREMSDAMQRRLQEPASNSRMRTMPASSATSTPSSRRWSNRSTLMAFADKYGFPLSKRLVDAEIAQMPNTKGLNGQVQRAGLPAVPAQQRLTDAEVRQILTAVCCSDCC